MHRFISQCLSAFTSLFYKRTILVLTLLLCAGIAASLWNISRLTTRVVKFQADQNAQLYAQAINTARTLYSDTVVEHIKADPKIHGTTLSDGYFSQEGGLPVPATFLIELGKRLSSNKDGDGMLVRLYSDYPFPNRREEGGPKDDFEREALEQLRKNHKKPFVRVEMFRGHEILRYAQADILQPSCMSCHNKSSDSPKKDWKVGDVRGVLEITTPLHPFLDQTQQGMRNIFIMLAMLSGLGLSGITLVIGRLRQTSKELELRVKQRTAQLQEMNEKLSEAQKKSERLLLNILPEAIAEQLKDGQKHIADGFTDVTILFADIVGFTDLSAQISPTQLVHLLNEIFSAFDQLSDRYELEKIKTIGDAYMVVGGIPKPRSDHADAIAQIALAMQQEVDQFNAKHNATLSIRIGINTGPVVAGVIGTKKFIYDLWGDAVNTASRMESHGVAGYIQVTESTYRCLRDQYQFEERGVIQVKGKGEMMTYFLTGRKVEQLATY
ncbi:MAG: adenylate/guanylate cyclase domain-containing protein [Cyanobacteriota bacterium]